MLATMASEDGFERPERTPERREKMAREREQKQVIRQILTDGKTLIDRGRDEAVSKKQKAFPLTTENLAAGNLTREQVATTIRQWLFDTYQNRVLLDEYDDDLHIVSFLVGN